MKKKMTILGVLALAVMVTAYSVAGTYAKYTSSIDITDEARVAKWDFKLANANTNGKDGAHKLDLFKSSYTYNTESKKWVNSFDGKNVVAPGTKGSAQFTLNGSIETAFTIDYNISADNDFIVYYTTDATGKTVTDMNTDKTKLTGDIKEYRPLTYTITHTRNGAPVDAINSVLSGKNAFELAEAFKTYNDNNADRTHIFTPGEYTLTFDIAWKWDVQNKVGDLNPSEVDKLDTYAGENLNTTTINFSINVVANQVAENHAE